MKVKLCKWMLAGIAVVAAIVLAWCLVPDDYVAVGTFYYWFPGLEYTSGRGEWGGQHPLDCFKEDVWDRRPRDFDQSVWRRFLQLRTDNGERRRQFEGAFQTVVFGASDIAITWEHIYVVAPNPEVAADVANACMQACADLERSQWEARKAAVLKNNSSTLERVKQEYRRLMDSTTSEMPNKSAMKKRLEMDALAKIGEELRNWDVGTNTMFKVMEPAAVPTNRATKALMTRVERSRKNWRKFYCRP